MKKTLITLLALAGVAAAATDLTYLGGNNNKDLTSIEDSNFPYLGLGNTYANSNILESITTVGNKDYNLTFDDTGAVSFIVNESLYFNQIYTTGAVTSYTITFGANGSLNAATKKDQTWGGSIQFTQNATVTLNIGVSEEQLANTTAGEIFKRTVINSTDTLKNAIWNVTDKLTVNAIGLNGYENVGLVADVTTLQAGQYGYMKVLSGDENSGGADGISLVFKAIPEPTTATLSLLALAGLAARRRRK